MQVIHYTKEDKKIYSSRQVLDFLIRCLCNVGEIHCDGTFSDDDVVELCQILMRNPADANLRAIHLPNNNLTIASAKAIGSLLSANTSLVKLNLSHNSFGCDGVDQIVVPLINSNTTLKSLNLKCNKLMPKAATSIGLLLLRNETLEEINLDNNDLGVKGLKVLAPKLRNNLLSLHLAYNHLKPRGVQFLASELQGREHKMEFLDLSCNQIGSKGMHILSEWLLVHQERNLRQLWLCSNDLGHSCGSMWGSIIEFNSSLIEIKLGGNELRDDGVKSLSRGLGSNHSLLRLELDWNQISDDGAEALANSLRRNGSLRLLDLSGNQIAVRGCIALAKALPYHLELRELNMKKNLMNDFAAEAFVSSLTEGHCVLDQLHWEENEDLSNEAMMNLKRAMNFKKNLKKLITPKFVEQLQQNKTPFLNWMDKASISDFELMKLSSLLSNTKSTKRLKVMYLGGIEIHSKGMESLSEWIGSTSCHLQSLFVCSTSMGDAGAKAIADALESNESLRELSLTGSKITSLGASLIGRSLIQHEILSRLNLAYNRITVDGLVALAKGVQHSMTLTSLNLSSNKLSIPMQSAVWDELVQTSIKELCLCDNELNDDIIVDLAHSLRTKCPFKILNFVDNKITEKGAWLVTKLLEEYRVKFHY